MAVDAVVAATKLQDAFGSGELGQRTLDLLSSFLTSQTLKSYAGKLSQFAEFCHDFENISPLEATTATVVRYVAWIGERGHIGAKSLQPYLSAINTFVELHNLDQGQPASYRSSAWADATAAPSRGCPFASPSVC
eukprot:jgi/Tetstr1/462098/TSEL_007166.t1